MKCIYMRNSKLVILETRVRAFLQAVYQRTRVCNFSITNYGLQALVNH